MHLQANQALVKFATDGQDIGMEFCIEKCAMLEIKQRQTRQNGRSRTTKSSSHQNAQRKRNRQIFGDIES